MNIALSIAGSDSGGAAGLQADLKTFHQFRVFGTTVVVAVTAQNTQGVRAVHPMPVELVWAQMAALADDLPPLATKSGMLATGELVTAVAQGIKRFQFPRYVLDPVMVATSGHRLLDAEAERRIATELVPLAALVTPNLDEARILIEDDVATVPQMEAAGRALLRMGAAAALVKGGHLESRDIVDVLVTPSSVLHLAHPRIPTRSTHGTGCTLSAAIAAGLAHGRDLVRAVRDALDYVHRAITAAPGLGAGHGPLNHTVEAPT